MIRLLNFLVSIRRLPPLSFLSGDEERMLFQLRELWERQGHLSVSDVYAICEQQSRSTSYRQLIALKEHGLVSVAAECEDRRRKRVTFTTEAERFFDRLNA